MKDQPVPGIYSKFSSMEHSGHPLGYTPNNLIQMVRPSSTPAAFEIRVWIKVGGMLSVFFSDFGYQCELSGDV